MGSLGILFVIYLAVSVLVALLLALIPATIAQSKGRRFGDWYVYGFLLFVVALVHSLLIRPTEHSQRKELIADGYKACPFCDEMIRPNAAVCRHCGRELGHEPRDHWSPDADDVAEQAWRQVEIEGDQPSG